MKPITIIFICFLSSAAGAVLFAIQQEWIIVRMPQIGTAPDHTATYKKNVGIHFWHDNRWHKEQQNLLWSDAHTDNLYYLVTNWLNTLDAEEVTNKKITVQSALISPSGNDAYLSFDQNPFDTQWSIYQKWMWLEGMLKTMREQKIPLQTVHILINHKPLIDRHLDCSQGWPISGFLSLCENPLQ